ncbi:hypothetical protein QBC37DRAFT_354563 [Rhypophila decipiens]|uniref:Uncharacterized protein n=1 Tax=Rhypophila decipiens TaxID=261697 RepID=A0AAN6XVS9_9PEZI|nr:hypothetical protein QBC37DRAFT_354563 [Rhypophila decipiens]
MKFTSSLFSLFALVSSVTIAAAGPVGPKGPKDPKPPSVSFLYSSNFTGSPDIYDVGPGPYGNRMARATTGGTFSGPKLKGTVLPIGGEHGLIGPAPHNNIFYVDLKQVLKTSDGAFIQIYVTGGTQPDLTDYISIRFETGSEKYFWLNAVVAFGVLTLSADFNSASYNAWILDPPPAPST